MSNVLLTSGLAVLFPASSVRICSERMLTTTREQTVMHEYVTLTLPKIGCQGCIKKIVSALDTVPTVEVVETSLPAKSVSLRYESSKTSIAHIESALQPLGHVIERCEVQQKELPPA
ncbi:copper chaperone [Ktedonosporobacter rubrisoli]|uniref:Copper chaperone n=1 Tax=Ktedonosporobacter rubrisoli TaxID=2509675 RepID=A0A4P6JL09_KTERU|nr:heavy-metal-associated domain-containing protein [Ktedonosporobacter rubrisoli]QBD75346.1 copper chaperone [Ktedonosporobacter rubrisoli]